uniref:HdeD family acid-resistance protein n=1 Tax=Candidatus Cryptobacteroides bacterium TaxID=3085639 RepID=UPI0040283946
MFTFGYKTTLSSILRSLASIGIGLVMIFDNEASETVVKVVAAFLFASGLVSLVYGLIRNKKEGLLPLMAVNAVVDILIGVLLFLNPGWVAGFIITLIGIVLILFGGLQLLALAGTMSLLGTGFGTLILSVCAVVGGAFLLFSPFGERIMGICAGSFLVLYGVSELISSWRIRKAKEAYEIRFNTREEPQPDQDIIETSSLDDAKEVDYTKVD